MQTCLPLSQHCQDVGLPPWLECMMMMPAIKSSCCKIKTEAGSHTLHNPSPLWPTDKNYLQQWMGKGSVSNSSSASASLLSLSTGMIGGTRSVMSLPTCGQTGLCFLDCCSLHRRNCWSYSPPHASTGVKLCPRLLGENCALR